MLVKESLNQLTIKELLILLKQGDMLSFDTIYKRFSRKLYGFVIRYIKIDADAEEIVQDVFIKIWETRTKIDTETSFEAYLFTIAYNSTISLIRKRASEEKYIEYLKSLQHTDNTAYPFDELHYKELTDKIEHLLDRLSPRQREIFQLSREEGLTHEEIAKKLNISTNTVKNHMVAVLSFLRSHINSELLYCWFFTSIFLLN